MKQSSFVADRKLIQALESRSMPVSCSEGHTLFKQGEVSTGVYILQSGEVALMMDSPSGRAVMSLQAGPGSLLGLPGVVGNEPHSMTAIVRKGSEVRFVTRNDFEDLFRAEPSLQLKVSLILAAEVRSARQAVSEA
jgi:CRP-like cAMP-binding protein